MQILNDVNWIGLDGYYPTNRNIPLITLLSSKAFEVIFLNCILSGDVSLSSEARYR